ncbi:MAG TPA: hypothetical protein VMV29_19480 [Ktedonobacterales bacterium]|nr:hypothetical protein [Ktedonobacterales bacterium]
MLSVLLSNPLLSTSIAIGAIIIPIFLAVRSAAQFVGGNQAYVRRFLTAALVGLILGVWGYEFDKVLEFKITGAIAAGLSLKLPMSTYGVVIGVFTFLVTLTSPIVRDTEKLNSNLLRAINTFLAGLSGAVVYCVATALAVVTFGWFGGVAPLALLIGLAILGFLATGIIALTASNLNLMFAHQRQNTNADPQANGVAADDVVTSGAATGLAEVPAGVGCVFSVASLISLVVSLPFFIILFRLYGLVGLLIYLGVSVGLTVGAFVISAIVEVTPKWVLIALAVLIAVAFQIISGYGHILALFSH